MAELVSFQTPDGATVEADVYGTGTHGVVLAHGKVFDKESWSDLANALSKDGLRVIAANFRGYGASEGPEASDGYANDVAGAVAYLRNSGCERISLLGGSMGAVAVAAAVTQGLATDIDTLILLSPRAAGSPEALHASHSLFVVSEDEDCADTVRAMHAAAPGEKVLKTYSGDAHAQFLFKSPHANDLIHVISATLNR